MIKKHRRLVVVTGLALIIYTLYVFVGPSYVDYPLPDYSREEVFQHLEFATEQLNIPSIRSEEALYSDFIANNSLGRYVNKQQFNQKQLKELEKQVPLYTFEVDSMLYTYQLDPNSGKLTSANNIEIHDDVDHFVTQYFGNEYTLQSEEESESIFSDWDIKQTYIAQTTFTDISKVVDIFIIDDVIVGFDYYGLADEYPVSESTTIAQVTVSLFIFAFFIILIIIVTIHLMIQLIRKRIETFWYPFIFSILAGVGWFFITKASGSSISGIGMLEPTMMTYLTFATLLIRWEKDSNNFRKKIETIKPSILNGFLAMIIAVTLAETFFLFASYFDTWVSPVLSHGVFINLNTWLLPIFTLCIGLSAAITEEAIFRNYMIPIFDRAGVLFSVIMTSVLWGVLHIGYDMYPWYLYVVEFIFITGPFFYFIYKKYGFSTSIFLHFFYNAWVTTLFLFSVDLTIAFASLIVMFSPFLLLLFGEKKSVL